MNAEHLAALQAGRERQLAEDERHRKERKAAFSGWVRRDARLWRNYLAAMGADQGVAAARKEWKKNLDAMPALP